MAKYSQQRICLLLNECDNARTSNEKGTAWENFTEYIFSKIPGLELHARNHYNPSMSEEIDLLFFNSQSQKGLFFLPNFVLVECKNWSNHVGASDVTVFRGKIENRGLSEGILIAANGISGTQSPPTGACDAVRTSFISARIKIIVFTKDELMGLRDTQELIKLIKIKLCEMVVGG